MRDTASPECEKRVGRAIPVCLPMWRMLLLSALWPPGCEEADLCTHMKRQQFFDGHQMERDASFYRKQYI